MTTAQTSETRPFNATAAQDVVEKASSSTADAQLGVVLSVRAEDDNYAAVMNEYLDDIKKLAHTVHETIDSFDTFVDENTGEIRMKVSPNFSLLLVQSNDMFWSVALDDRR